MIKIIFFLYFFHLLTACDVIHGVGRSSEINHIPASECIVNTLSKVQEISDIRYEEDRFDRNTPGYLAGNARTSHLYHYTLYDFPINLVFREFDRNDMPSTYSTSFGMMHVPPPQDKVNQLRGMLFRIEEQIEKECKIDLTTNLKEECSKLISC